MCVCWYPDLFIQAGSHILCVSSLILANFRSLSSYNLLVLFNSRTKDTISNNTIIILFFCRTLDMVAQLFPEFLAESVFFQKKIEFWPEGMGLLDVSAYLLYFSKNAYNFKQLELLKFYFLTTTWTRILC